MRNRVVAIVASSLVVVAGSTVPAVGQGVGSDDCTLSWVTAEDLDAAGDRRMPPPDKYFGDSRMDCPVLATVGGRWELDGQELESFTEQQGPGVVAVFDDINLSTTPGRELCFIVTAWFNDKGKACLTT